MNKGQIAMGTLIGWGLALASASIGFTLNQVGTLQSADRDTVQRVSKLEEAIGTIKDDNKDIKRLQQLQAENLAAIGQALGVKIKK